MATRTSKQTRAVQHIVEADAAVAAASAERAVISSALELAPLSWAQLKALPAGGVGPALAALPAHLVRPQAVRFLVERRTATGKGWGWGDVDTLEAWIRSQIAAARVAA